MSLSPQRRHRPLRRMAVLVILTLICCGLFAVYFRSHRNEQREADEEIVRYLGLVQERDGPRADAMLCGGDDTSIAQPEGADERWRLLPIRSFAIVHSWDWSSVVDGHGRAYSIRLTFADGSTTICDFVVEVIGNDPCIGTEVPL